MTDATATTPITDAPWTDNLELIALREALFDALAAAGITCVLVEFDGSGDEGQVDSIFAQAGEDWVGLPSGVIPVRAPHFDSPGPDTRACPIAEVVETIVYAHLEDNHCDWENCDGAFGTFTFEVAERSIRLEYKSRRMTYDVSEHVF